ncbi:DNA polymerase Y family protein [Brachybacterium sp. EF45031]|uniref:DNA polymerase Y family protein n=1 Tax=Brachybacterium sillae TaxID=2810536 RepID=UPI00217D1375|nr:DNA polymerase Y family protein [Brachybacterium sillae]MCS6710642.1 DNA polymerase Y family protein [Brachybacterium sillae]
MSATRTAAVVVPDWPLLAARDREERRAEAAGQALPAGPMILLEQHRVTHADAAARAAGIVPGMRRRAARAACPEALVLEADAEYVRSTFELVAAAVDTVASGVDVLRPGVLLFAARGPARHAGGEARLAERIVDAVADLTGWDCSVGVADGPFAALLAARSGRIVHPGDSARYLAPHPIAALVHAPVGEGWGHRDQPAAVHAPRRQRTDLQEVALLLGRLGLATLGDFAALDPGVVADRFGPDVAAVHLLCRGLEASPPAAHHPPQPVEAVQVLETPLVRTDQAAFVARPLAESLQEQLTSRGLVCTRLRIVARCEDGTEKERTWRHDGALSVADVVDRIRWQCDGWITASRLGQGQGGAIVALGLHPVQLMPAGEWAPALWGSAGESARRAARALARAQGLGGEDAVLVPAPVGGRLLGEQVELVPWRSERPAPRPGPWPGALPQPLPATVFRTPPPVELLTGQGEPVVVTARGLLSGVPQVLRLSADSARALHAHDGAVSPGELTVSAHSAPTVLDVRWWSPQARRGARLQLVARTAAHSLALVLLSDGGRWAVEGMYD